MSRFSFIPPQGSYPLPRFFDYDDYIQTEREFWALFPETDGKRVNFCQMGLTAWLFVESSEAGELACDETYFLMPCADRHLRPVRMRSVRRMTLDEFRMSHITALKLADLLSSSARVLDQVHCTILGPGVLGD